MSGVNQLIIDNILRSLSSVVHPSDPFHLIFSFEFLCNTLLLCQLLNRLGKHSLCLGVNLNQMVIQLASEK